MSEQNKRIPYLTDLSDINWEIIKSYFPDLNSYKGRKCVHSYREILNAVLYLLRSGCSWRMLLHEFPHWKTIYHYFRIWRLDGTCEHLNSALRTKLRIASGRDPEPIARILDSQSVKTQKR